MFSIVFHNTVGRFGAFRMAFFNIFDISGCVWVMFGYCLGALWGCVVPCGVVCVWLCGLCGVVWPRVGQCNAVWGRVVECGAVRRRVGRVGPQSSPRTAPGQHQTDIRSAPEQPAAPEQPQSSPRVAPEQPRSRPRALEWLTQLTYAVVVVDVLDVVPDVL